MKLYMFYLIDSSLIKKFSEMHVFKTGDVADLNKPFLYAFTADKKKARRFERSRNMDVFLKVRESIDEENYERTLLHTNSKILDFPVSIGGSRVEIPVTENEMWLLERPSETMFDYLKGHLKLPPLAIFTGKTHKFLYQISYGYVAGCDVLNDCDYEDIEGMKEFQNEFGVFVYLFGDIINYPGLIDMGRICDEQK